MEFIDILKNRTSTRALSLYSSKPNWLKIVGRGQPRTERKRTVR